MDPNHPMSHLIYRSASDLDLTRKLKADKLDGSTAKLASCNQVQLAVAKHVKKNLPGPWITARFFDQCMQNAGNRSGAQTHCKAQESVYWNLMAESFNKCVKQCATSTDHDSCAKSCVEKDFDLPGKKKSQLIPAYAAMGESLPDAIKKHAKGKGLMG